MQIARRKLVRVGAIQRRGFGLTFGHYMRASDGELAPALPGRRDRRLSCLPVGLPMARRVGERNGANQQLGIRMARLIDNQLHSADFGDGASIQDNDVLADLIGGRQIVRDVNNRDAEFLSSNVTWRSRSQMR